MRGPPICRRDFFRQGFLAAGLIPLGFGEYCIRGSVIIASLSSTSRVRHDLPHYYSRPGLDPNRLAHFVDPLPTMPTAQPGGSRRAPDGATAAFYRIRMSEFFHKMHRDLPPT